MSEPSIELSLAQRAVVETTAKRVLVRAGPGAGKSASLVERGLFLLREHLVGDPSSVLFVTFTIKAAEEIEERIGSEVWSSTFHSLCYRLLGEYGERISWGDGPVLRPPFTVLDETDQLALMQEVLHDSRWKMSARKLVDWYNLGEPEGGHPRLASGMTKSRLLDVLHEYEQRKADSNAVDFRGLVTVLLRTLVTDPDFLISIRNRFDAILADEFQDVDPIQMVLLRLLVRPDTYFTVVADGDQSLYHWRMANPDLIRGKIVPVLGLPPEVAELSEVSLSGWGSLRDEQEWECHNLVVNYRSGREIVAGSRRLIEHNVDREPLELTAFREEAGQVFVYRYPYMEEAEAILRLVEQEKAVGGSLAFLTRTNFMAREVARILRDDGRWPFYLVGGDDDIWQDVQAKKLLYVLRACSNRFDRWTALRVVHLLSGRVDPVVLARIRSMASAVGQDILSVALGELGHDESLDSIRNVQRMPDSPGKILAAFGCAKQLMRWTPIQERIETYAMTWVAAGRRLSGFLFFASYHKEAFREERELEPGTIWISTSHAGKGLQFDTVIVAGCEPGEFPTPRPDNPEEERRVFYVAMTRARNRLIFAHTDTRIKYQTSRPAGPSPYLAEAWPAGLEDLALDTSGGVP